MNDFDVVTGSAPAKLIPPPPVAEKPRETPRERAAPAAPVPKEDGANEPRVSDGLMSQFVAVPAQAGTQGERRAVALDARFRGQGG